MSLMLMIAMATMLLAARVGPRGWLKCAGWVYFFLPSRRQPICETHDRVTGSKQWQRSSGAYLGIVGHLDGIGKECSVEVVEEVKKNECDAAKRMSKHGSGCGVQKRSGWKKRQEFRKFEK